MSICVYIRFIKRFYCIVYLVCLCIFVVFFSFVFLLFTILVCLMYRICGILVAQVALCHLFEIKQCNSTEH